MKPTRLRPFLNRPRREPQVDELIEPEDRMLASAKSRDSRIRTPKASVSFAFGGRLGHTAIVTPIA
jgi:hypothetical protein